MGLSRSVGLPTQEHVEKATEPRLPQPAPVEESKAGKEMGLGQTIDATQRL